MVLAKIEPSANSTRYIIIAFFYQLFPGLDEEECLPGLPGLDRIFQALVVKYCL
jgi:hypothetical protein